MSARLKGIARTDVNDVALFERALVWYTVADDLVNGPDIVVQGIKYTIENVDGGATKWETNVQTDLGKFR